ncbi:MAG: CRISPR-associated endonuclease Cas1 [Pseudomonadota bacterium]|nr:CRISPR-associated endonuclease Cas1 [Pseudomonadota bacterium]
MTTLYLDRRDLSLSLEGRALALYADGERQGTVPLHLLERVVMRSSVQIQSSLLARLADAGVGMLAFGGRNASKIATMQGRAHIERAQARIAVAAILPVETLRGIEGAAAAAYFKAFTRLFPDSLEFTGRNRRPPRDPVNAVLSLGYTLLHFEAVRACYVAGLDPIIGYFHELDFARESLASDLIEPLRPKVDAWAWELFRDRHLREDHFAREGDACLLGKAGRQHFFGGFEALARPTRRLLRRFVGKLAAGLVQAGTTTAGAILGIWSRARGRRSTASWVSSEESSMTAKTTSGSTRCPVGCR